MVLPLPFGMETARSRDYFETEVGRFVKALSYDRRDHLANPDQRALTQRLSLINQFIGRAHETGRQLEAELPGQLPPDIRRFMAFGTLLTAFGCWIEVGTVKREVHADGRACYSVEVRLNDQAGAFPSASRNAIAIGLQFLPGDVEPEDPDREIGGFFSAYAMAASQLIASAFVLNEFCPPPGGSPDAAT